MTFLQNASDFIIPLVITSVLVSGLCGTEDLYELFTAGAANGIKITVKILPSVIGLMMAVNMLRACGSFELIGNFAAPFLKRLGLPAEILPLVFLRPVSGSASLGITADILKSCGADSYTGRLASVIMGATETTFYTISLFFGAAGTEDSGKTVTGALFANITAVICSVIFLRLFFFTHL